MSEEKIHKIYVEVPDRSAQRVEKYIVRIKKYTPKN